MDDLLTTFLEIEARLANDSGATYERILRDDALVIVPGAVLTKQACIEAVAASSPWDEDSYRDPVLLRTGSTVTIVYRFEGRRGDQRYAAVMASTYELTDGDWRIVLHQQTPE